MFGYRSLSAQIILFSLRFLLYFLAFLLIFAGHWIHESFGAPSFEQVLFSVFYEPSGLAKTDPALIEAGRLWCGVLPLGATVIVCSIELLLYGLQKWRFPLAPWLGLATGLCFLLTQLSFGAYLRGLFGVDYIGHHYRDPKQSDIKGRRTKNLIYIYLESMETGYRDTKLFDKNLIEALDADALKGVSFAAYRQAPGTNYTIAAQVATQCGIPLKVILNNADGNAQGEQVKSFLHSAHCLGDILREHGYYNVFLQGSSLDFAGQGRFWGQHGFDEVYGTEDLLERGYVPGGWGVTDDSLFAEAKRILPQLRSRRQPFNLTMALVDTHHTYGILSQTCKSMGYHELTGIVECTALMTADFVRYLRVKGYLRNTQVVIVGDHLAMENTVYDKLLKTDRTIFNVFVGEGKFKKNREEILHFDLLPTVLNFLGFDLSEGRLGLGYSGFGRLPVEPDSKRLEEMQQSLMNQSPSYLELWR